MEKFVDAAIVGSTKTTQEGYLVADVYTVRSGIQRYAGAEVGRPDLAFVDVYRPDDEVFAVDAVASFSHVPVTVDHPPVFVTADNWRKYAVGEASSEVMRDGQRLRIPLVLKDKAAITAVKNGKRELSAGYTCQLDWTEGVTPEGESYQAIQRNIRANHIATVDRGRAGHEFRIGDTAAWGIYPVEYGVSEMNLQTVVVDGISIQTTDQGAQALDKVTRALNDSTAHVAKLNDDLSALRQALADKDAEIGALKVEVQTAKATDVDALVDARTALLADATALVPAYDGKGKSAETVRREVVTQVYGDVTGVSDAEVSGVFRALRAQRKDKVKDAVYQGKAGKPAIKTTDSQTAYDKRIADAWKDGK